MLTMGGTSLVRSQPYASYMASALVNSQVLNPGCYQSRSYSKEPFSKLFNGSRLLMATNGQVFASSGLFYMDFFAGLVWTGLGWVAIGVAWMCWREWTLTVANVVVRVQQSFYLLLAYSLAANFQDLSTKAQIAGLVLGVAYAAYVAGCLVYFTNRLYLLNQEEETRFMQAR
jgi:hypothetical protein